LYEAQITVLTPFPGTPLYRRLLAQGRIIEPGAWERCTLFDVNFVPELMTVEELERGFRDLMARIYDRSFVSDRRRDFLRKLRTLRRSTKIAAKTADARVGLRRPSALSR
jgi:radical SAM superfamily enzyme YgiQ (UPF0313 family)